MGTSTRDLMSDAADRSASYLEGIASQPVFPRAADIERLRAALEPDLPAGRTADAEVLGFLDT